MGTGILDDGSIHCQEEQLMNGIYGNSNYEMAAFVPTRTWGAVMLLFLVIVVCSLANTTLLLNCFIEESSERPVTKPFRVLYVVASMAEYQTGDKGTVAGEDRFANTFVPIVSNTAHSVISKYPDWDLDVYLIIGYNIRPERYNYLRNKLPEGVGLQLWEDAIPLSYNSSKGERLKPNVHSMNRQHRFVLRDKLDYYDLFIVGEDDMAINAAHVEQYLDIQREIDRLREEAVLREQLQPEPNEKSYNGSLFYGNLSSTQLSQMMPGFIRVEVYLEDYQRKNTVTGSALFNSELKELIVDPKPCCHLHQRDNLTDPLRRLPLYPKSHQLLIWETAIHALGVRKFPASSHLGWVAYLPGVVDDKLNPATDFYWSGRSGILGKDPVRPSPHNLHLFAHQAMYIMTREQILRLDKQICQGRFLPPFSSDVRRNGIFWAEEELFLNSAEFMVGGLQLYTQGAKNAKKAGCNLQRIVSLANFSKHLIYHVSNNKQRTINAARHVLADDLLRQLSYVKKKASEVCGGV